MHVPRNGVESRCGFDVPEWPGLARPPAADPPHRAGTSHGGYGMGEPWAGLGEKVVYLEPPDDVPARALLRFLAAQRVPVESAVARGQLQVLAADRDVLALQGLADVVERPVQQGYPGVRFSGEAATAQACRGPPTSTSSGRRTCCVGPGPSRSCASTRQSWRARRSPEVRDAPGRGRQTLMEPPLGPGGIAIRGEVDVSNHDVLRWRAGGHARAGTRSWWTWPAGVPRRQRCPGVAGGPRRAPPRRWPGPAAARPRR